MAKRSGSNSISYWGVYPTAADLPNVLGAAKQTTFLEVGDQAYVTGTASFYVCTDATINAAAWIRVAQFQTLTALFNLNGDLDFAVLGTAGTAALAALFDGTRSVAVAGAISNVIVHQQGDGTGGTTTIEVYRRRAGVFTLLTTISIASGGGDYAQNSAVPAGALATIQAGDRWYAQPIAVQAGGLNVSVEVQYGVVV